MDPQSASLAERPNRLAWPPMLYAAGLVAGLGLQAIMPVPLPMPTGSGLVLGIPALVLDAAAIATLWRERTTVMPNKGALRLVTGGPYAFTRNPIYVGNTLLLVALAFGLSNGWLILAAAAAAVAVHHLAILREERHLALRFGADWQVYASRVPRWIGLPRRS